MKAIVTLEVWDSSTPEDMARCGITEERAKRMYEDAFTCIMRAAAVPGATYRVAQVEIVNNTAEG